MYTIHAGRITIRTHYPLPQLRALAARFYRNLYVTDPDGGQWIVSMSAGKIIMVGRDRSAS